MFQLPLLLLLAWCTGTVCFVFCLLILLYVITMLLLLSAALQVSHRCDWDVAAWHRY
jgi:hypothetical protein